MRLAFLTAVKRLSDGLVLLYGYSAFADVDYSDFIWARVKTRKAFTCSISETDFPSGTMAYSPITNKCGRSTRIAEQTILDFEAAQTTGED